MDLDLLSSPQLYSLEFTVLYQNDQSNVSEFPVLTQILLRSKNLRILRLGCESDACFRFQDYQNQYAAYGTEGKGPLSLSLKEGDKFPPLEELVLIPPTDEYSRQPYQVSQDHCLSLKSSLDLSKLQTLDLGRTSSHVFFAELTGCVPNLRSFRFTILNPTVSYQSPGYIQRVTAEFLDCLSDLRELHIDNQSMQYYPKLWPIIQRHALTLQKLSMDVPEQQIEDKPEEIPASTGFLSNWRRKSKEQAPNEVICDYSIQLNTSFFKMLAFPNLSSLKISLKLKTPTGFALGLNANAIEKLVEIIFCNFFSDNPNSKIEMLEFRVERLQLGFHGNGLEKVVVKIVRSGGSVVPNLKEGGYVSTSERSVVAV